MNLKDLTRPFEAKDIEWRLGSTKADKSQGLALPYLTNRAIQERLDKVCGPENWRNEFERWGDKSVKCGISIRCGTSENSGEEEWVTKYDGAGETNIEATKGGFSDAMKRAAVQWGIGRYLYDLPPIWVELDKSGRFFAKGTDRIIEAHYNAAVKGEHSAPGRTATVEQAVTKALDASTDKCPACSHPICADEISFSRRHFGSVLCRDCQKKRRALESVSAKAHVLVNA